MSPWASAKQERWGNSAAGHAALGAAKVEEFNNASRGMKFGQAATMSKSKRGSAAARLITKIARKRRPPAKPARPKPPTAPKSVAPVY